MKKREREAFQKNSEVELEITDMSTEGAGIGKIQGFPFFVKDAVKGDIVKAKVMKCKKNYGFARLMEVISPSPDRIPAPCPIAGPCGGCQLQHLSYEAELRFKEKRVRDALNRIGGIYIDDLTAAEEPIAAMAEPYRYRNKAQFPIGYGRDGKISAGFYVARTHSIIPCSDCLLTPPEFSAIMQKLLEKMNEFHILPYNENSGEGIFRHVLIRKGFGSGEIMVCLVAATEDIPHLEELVEVLKGFPEIVSICLNLNEERTNVILGSRTKTLWGKAYIMDKLDSLQFRISPLSFYQVNPYQAERIYKKIVEYASIGNAHRIWDLCCGIGTISLFLAHAMPYCKVHGIEIVPEAIEDAKKNAVLNGISNVDFTAAAVEDQLQLMEGEADVVIADPPRKGLLPSALEAILKASPSHIVYMSCDPATLARDLKVLCEGGYRLKAYQAYDFFSRTGHVETIVLLQGRDTL
ncbi:MAG: 23S rRNA (uracil(1939)-C(5))-methyltransferase RlmD [Lachnospiraceae bacterium]|nr:23S rRNA (uracil(1939)-C(5))-methyltransferase RlmD [Lachnospiraceae bacterium]